MYQKELPPPHRILRSDNNFRLRRPGHRAPVDRFQQHRQLRHRQRYHTVLGLRPDKLATIQLLGTDTFPDDPRTGVIVRDAGWSRVELGTAIAPACSVNWLFTRSGTQAHRLIAEPGRFRAGYQNSDWAMHSQISDCHSNCLCQVSRADPFGQERSDLTLRVDHVNEPGFTQFVYAGVQWVAPEV